MKRFVLPLSCLLLIAASSFGDPFDRAVDALGSGTSAAIHGDKRRLQAAALALRASGAVPAAGEEDLTARWLRAAPASPRAAERDRVMGPGYRAFALDAGGGIAFEQIFLAGQRARIAVVSPRRADFHMRVRGEQQEIVCESSPSRALCDWVPSFTARFRIEMRNPGRQAAQYYVVLQ